MATSDLDVIVGDLNKEQQLAVESVDGPVMVLAGPGTGKTQVLAARIAYILKKTDTPPYAILALTFTESAAANMRERVVSIIGKDGYYVNISTFHSFCADVIRSNPEYFLIDKNSEPLGELEKYELFQRLIDVLTLKEIKPLNMPYFYIDDIISSISQLKKEGVLPDDFKKILKKEFAEKNVPDKATEKVKFFRQKAKNLDLLEMYKNYQERLHDIQRYDFDDMIAFVVEAFKKNKNLLRDYQEKLHYFLVDEYQDTNSAQNMVVDLLGSYWGEKANIFVVGDPHQSIFRFQGASIENTMKFSQKYRQAKVIKLETVYRCSQNICDAALDVIKNNKLTHVPELRSVHADGDLVQAVVLPTQTHEIFYAADTIKKLIEGGTALEDIAILYRRNSEAAEVQGILEKWGIRYEVDGGEDILSSEAIQELLRFLHLISDLHSSEEDETMFEVLSYTWVAVDKTLVMKAARAAGKAKLSIFALVQAGFGTFIKYHKTEEVTPIEFHQLEDFIKKLVSWAHDDAHMPFTAWFEHVLKESGFLTWILMQPAKSELLINLNSLYREIKAMTASNHRFKLTDFIHALDTMIAHKIHIFAEDFNVHKGAVHLSTVHKAKGREWEYVFLIHCYDGNWGNVRKYDLIPLPQGLTPLTDLSQKEKNEDERRLFYVAITRARKGVYLTYPETLIRENRTRAVVPSMFIYEIDTNNIKMAADVFDSESANTYLEKLIEPHAPLIHISDKDFLTRLVKGFKLSSTALNTYLKDKEEFVKNSLLKVPRAKSAPMAFGTAVHAALEGAVKNKALVYEMFENALRKEILTDEEFARRLVHGNEMLKKYIDAYRHEKPDILFVERQFGYGFGKTVYGDIPLTGRIDRVDWIDKKKKTVRVIDYKTGRAKSKNDIEGKIISANLSDRERALPESIRGPYKRQLLFYKLLTELDQTFIPTVEEGLFDFIEADKTTGKLTRQLFPLRDDEVKDLKELIREVMAEIRALKFLEG